MQSALSSQTGKRAGQPTISNPTGWRSTPDAWRSKFDAKPKTTTKMKCRLQNADEWRIAEIKFELGFHYASECVFVQDDCDYEKFFWLLFLAIFFFKSPMHFFWIKVGQLVRHKLQLLAYLTTRDHAYTTKL